MSFSKSFIRGVFAEATDEQIRSLIDEHMESVTSLQNKITSIEQERDKYKSEAATIPDLNKQIKDLQGDGTDWKAKYTEEVESHKQTKADYEAKETRANKTAAFRSAAKEAGIADKYLDTLIRASASEIDALELDEKGAVKDGKTLTESFKSNWGDFIATTTQVGAKVATPPASHGGTYKSREEIMAIADRDQRRKAIAENPQLFNK